MSILDQYAKQTSGERRTKTAGTKLEPTLYKKFVEHCNKRGLNTSEALRFLIIELLKEPTETKVNQKEENKESRLTKVSEGEQSETNSKPKATRDNNKKGKGNKSTIPWQVNGLLPCPLCNEPRWITRTNYARHVQRHGYQNGYEMIQENLDAVERMVQEKKTKQ